MIDERHVANLTVLSENFKSSRPFKHIVVDDFFDHEVATALLDNFPKFENPELLLNEFGAPNPKKVISNVRNINEFYRNLDDYIRSRKFLGVIEKITGIEELLYDPDYVGAGTHENFSTAGLDPHYDFNILPKVNLHRRINCIVYLNERWSESWGGQINLHRDAWDLDDREIVRIDPIFNRCVIFETNQRSWHSVTPVSIPVEEKIKSRKSFTIYLYSRSRPKEEEAPPHGTVYVQLPISKEIQPNKLLTQEQYTEIRSNIQRRHSYLRVMYQKEYGLHARLSRVEAELRKWKLSPGIQLLGDAIVTSVRSPMHPDKWIEDELIFTMRCFSSFSKIKITGLRPVEWGIIELSIKLVGMNAEVLDVFEVKGDFEFIKELDLHFNSLPADFELVIMASGAMRSSDIDSRKLAFNLGKIVIQ
jgi:hypothetical protein